MDFASMTLGTMTVVGKHLDKLRPKLKKHSHVTLVLRVPADRGNQEWLNILVDEIAQPSRRRSFTVYTNRAPLNCVTTDEGLGAQKLFSIEWRDESWYLKQHRQQSVVINGEEHPEDLIRLLNGQRLLEIGGYVFVLDVLSYRHVRG